MRRGLESCPGTTNTSGFAASNARNAPNERRRTGISADTIRFYEKRGLFAGKRLGNGYRDYSTKDLEQAELIALGKSMGFRHPADLVNPVKIRIRIGKMHFDRRI